MGLNSTEQQNLNPPTTPTLDENASYTSNDSPTVSGTENSSKMHIYGYDDDEDLHSGEIDRPYNGVFEGPEKTLEVFFRPIHEDTDDVDVDVPLDGKRGMRQLGRPELDRICRRARCTILSSVSNQYLDAYVLSESSLFVYPRSLVLKTCGTTTLLRCVATLIELSKRVGLEIDWLGYSRKNFTFPWDQAFPHESFHQELEYLSSHRSLSQRLDGNGYTLGPVTGDHWFVFVADHTRRFSNTQDTDRVLNIMMFDIDQDVAQNFYFDHYEGKKDDESEDDATRRISSEQTKKAGIDILCPGYSIDPRAFEPCGYSMNAILFGSYITMHITPEDGSSYASFETNQQVASYNSLINNVVRTFRPKRFVMTLMADEDGLKQMKHVPFTAPASEAQFIVPTGNNNNNGKDKHKDAKQMQMQMRYKRSSVASIAVEDDCHCMMGNWTLQEDTNPRKEKIRGYSFA